MLHNVPKQLNLINRNVVIHHPNTFVCEVWRKRILRESDEEFAGKPTFGGAGVIDSGDEEDFTYDKLGYGYALPCTQFETAPMSDALDANVGASDEFPFLIVSDKQSSEEGYFEIRNHDIMYVLLGETPHEAKLAYEIVKLQTTTNISPFTVSYICNRRGDMDISEEENPANQEESEE